MKTRTMRKLSNRKRRPIQIDVDYDKLADAIVKAQKQAEIKSKEDFVQKQDEKQSFWKNVWNIIWNKGDSEGRLLNGSIIILLSFLFRVMAVIGVVAAACIIYGIFKYFISAPWNGAGQIITNIIAIVIFALFALIIALYSLVIKGAANDIEREKDKNYVMAVFSGIIGLAALVVAVIALVKT